MGGLKYPFTSWSVMTKGEKTADCYTAGRRDYWIKMWTTAGKPVTVVEYLHREKGEAPEEVRTTQYRAQG